MQDLGLTARVIVVWGKNRWGSWEISAMTMRAAWPALCLLWEMVALTHLPRPTHKDKQSAGGDGNVSLKMMEQGVTGGCLSLSFCVWDEIVCLYGEKLSVGYRLFFFSHTFIVSIAFYVMCLLPIYLSVMCLCKDSIFCHVVCLQDKRCVEIAHSPSLDVFLPEDEDNPYESVATAVTRKPCSLDINLHNACPRNG